MPTPEVDPFKEVIEGDFSRRIDSLSPDLCSFEAALQNAEAWRANGNFFVFKAGAFDVLTLNHVLALIQFRTLGAMALLGVDQIKTDIEQRAVHELAASEDIKLMITLGTNAGVAEGKAHDPEKGGVPKPILDWRSRAAMLALQSIPLPGYEMRRSAVDYITRHGPGCCDVCEVGSCVNENNDNMALHLRPDLVVITEWQQAAGNLETYKRQGLLPDTRLAVVREEENQYVDPLLEGPIKTTSIINRLLS